MTNYNVEYLSLAPYDSALNTAKLPITLEYLSDVKGEVYIKKAKILPSLKPIETGFAMGGMKSKGFGVCKVEFIKEFEPKILKQEGVFLSRIYYDDEIMKHFGISSANITKAYWGYLFRKTSEFNGYYQKSLFEQSIIINGYDFLVEVTK
jgi:CRISPR/Cas system CSM-associated protein Csm4 (group 5 of RAMP superfamily)